MAQSVLQVRRLWEAVTTTPLSSAHRSAFLDRPEALDLAALPRLVVEVAAESTHVRTGELRLATWLDTARRRREEEPPLRIEMVPSTCWWSNLRSELPDAQWAVCKRWSGQRAGWRCEVCGDRGPRWPVECHEQWQYLDDARPRVQRLAGLISLCLACHESTHMGFASINGRLEEALVHLAQVNGWDRQRAEAHLDACELVWEERSRHQWQLDVDWLAREVAIAVEVTPPRAPR